MDMHPAPSGRDAWVVRGRVIRWIDPLTEPPAAEPRHAVGEAATRHLAGLLRAVLPRSIDVRPLV